MKKMSSRLLALALSLMLVFGLVGCGGSENKTDDHTESTSSGITYVPTFKNLTSPVRFEFIDRALIVNGSLYFATAIQEDAPVNDSSAADTEQMDGYVTDDMDIPFVWRQAVLRLDMETGAVEELDALRLPAETPETSVYVQNMCAGADGSIWICTTETRNQFDLPADFDSTSEDKWQYWIGSDEVSTWHRLDAEGNEISSFSTDGFKEKMGIDWMPSGIIDDDGDVYMVTDKTIYVLSAAGDIVTKIEGTAQNGWGELIRLKDGTVGVQDWGGDNGVASLSVIDKAAGKIGATYPIEGSFGSLRNGTDKYLFTYQNGDSVFGYDAEKKQGVRLFRWSDSDINNSTILTFAVGDDGNVSAITQEWSDEGGNFQLVTLKPVDSDTLPEKTHLILAAQYLDYNVKSAVLEFNRSHNDIRIDIRDYAEFNTGDDYTAGLTKLNTEIVAGKVPDILVTNGIPLDQYAARGILEDLWTFIDNDPDLGRDKLMTRPLEAAERGGILPQVFPNFGIQTLVGSTRVVGDRYSWTIVDAMEALKAMPEGAKLLPEWMTKRDVFTNLLSQSMNQFIDWENGDCSFDSKEFQDILLFCSQFPTEYDWEKAHEDGNMVTEEELIMSGKQLLQMNFVSDLMNMQNTRRLFGGEFSYIGYPVGEGHVGSAFTAYGGFAMSSTCKNKDAAWSFIRQILLDPCEGMSEEEIEEYDQSHHGYQFSINKACFDRYIARDMKKEYELDEDGNQVLDENGQPIEVPRYSWNMEDGTEVRVMAATEEDLAKFMGLYEAVDSIYNYEGGNETFEMIAAEAEPFFKGDQSVEQVTKQIQSRMKFYVNEQR